MADASARKFAAEVESLKAALKHRDVIGQAKGILMATENINAEAAFDILVRASQRENRKLYDVAAELVDHYGHSPATQADNVATGTPRQEAHDAGTVCADE